MYLLTWPQSNRATKHHKHYHPLANSTLTWLWATYTNLPSYLVAAGPDIDRVLVTAFCPASLHGYVVENGSRLVAKRKSLVAACSVLAEGNAEVA